jgi:SAM-dependent methyltransferase
LLEVAGADAAARGLDATFAPGEAAALPLGDGEADVVLSVFGVIFAPDPAAAAAEMTRIKAPGGRIVLSAWIPGGAVSAAVRASREAVAEALGAPPPAPPFPWHERDALAELFAPHGFGVAIDEHSISFGARSSRDFLAGESANHPLAVAGRAVLEPRGEVAALDERILSIYDAANEDPDGFRVTSRYVVATIRA